MTIQTFEEQLKAMVGDRFKANEPLSAHTSIRIGGSADFFVSPQDIGELETLLNWAVQNHVPYWILGAGTNMLVRDGGLRGLVITLKHFNQCKPLEGNRVEAGAGLPLPRLVEWSLAQGLVGLETLTGIPGALGGAITMNAGTRDGEIAPLVESVTCLVKNNATSEAAFKQTTLGPKQLCFSYRSSKLPKGAVITGAVLKLEQGDVNAARARYQSIKEKRLKSQPLDSPNLGSVFKNVSGKKGKTFFAGALIEEAELKGVRVGQARISEKHGNFIINEGGATARDVLSLIGLIRDKVKERFDILLEPEIKIIGEDTL